MPDWVSAICSLGSCVIRLPAAKLTDRKLLVESTTQFKPRGRGQRHSRCCRPRGEEVSQTWRGPRNMVNMPKFPFPLTTTLRSLSSQQSARKLSTSRRYQLSNLNQSHQSHCLLQSSQLFPTARIPSRSCVPSPIANHGVQRQRPFALRPTSRTKTTATRKFLFTTIQVRAH